MNPNDLTESNAEIFVRLLDAFPDMIHSVANDGTIVYANRRAEDLLGYTREELIGKPVRDIYADEVLDEMEAGFADLKREGDARVESILKTAKGAVIPVEIRSFSIYDDDGTFIRTFSILRDQRPIKELQNSLVHAGRLAAIGELSSGIAHDINNPLTVVLISTEMILSYCADAAEGRPAADGYTQVQSAAEDVRKAANSIRKLSDHLRNFARGVKEDHSAVDLHRAIEDALFITDNRIRAAGVTLTQDVCTRVHYVKGSTNQLEQLFVNLIANACDELQEHPDRELAITLSTEAQDGGRIMHVCRVADSGAGVPDDLGNDAFRPFITTKPAGKGTGLGLSIAKNIVKEHGGRIDLEDSPLGGACFAVRLPAIEAPVSATSRREAP